MRIIRISQNRRYPRYIAEKREGRHKGQYPTPEIRYVPSLKREWDRGGFGTGTKLIEIEADSPQGLLDEIHGRGYSPVHDEFEFFEIRGLGSPRVRIPTQRLFSMARSPANTNTGDFRP